MKLNPKDIDLVTLISHDVFPEYATLIEQKFRKSSLSEYGIDAYFVIVYPEGHSKFALYKGNLAYWDNQFSKTRKNRVGKRFDRGYTRRKMVCKKEKPFSGGITD